MLSALAFLTVLGGSRDPADKAVAWFPAIGAGIGGILALVWLGATELWSPAVAALLVVAADLVLTGMLHLDGLADTADGLLPPMERSRRLGVMRTPEIGAFGVAAVGIVLLARWVSLAGDLVEPEALVAVWAASRTVVAVVPAIVPYARDDGLASPFLAGARRWHAVWLAPAAVLLAAAHQLTGLAALAAGLAAATGVLALARRRIGGFTGDVLGAAVLACETVILIVLNAE